MAPWEAMKTRMGVLALAAGLSACAPAVTGGHHVKNADDALARGDLDAASAGYDGAMRDRGDDEWTIAAVRRGRAKIEVEKMRRDANVASGTVFDLNARRVRLRELGGDAAIDAALVTALQPVAQAEVERVEQLLAKRSLADAGGAARGLIGVADVPEHVQIRARAVLAAAADLHFERARAAGTSYPLAARAHQVLATFYAGGGSPDASTLVAPYRKSVTVTTSPCEHFAPLLTSALETPSSERRVDVEITFDRCRGNELKSDTVETVSWNEEVFDHYETRYEEKCYDVQRQVAMPGIKDCHYEDVGDRTATQVCEQKYTTVPVRECERAPIEVAVTRTETRTGTRTATTTTWSIDVSGRWRVRRGGVDLRGTFSGSRSATALTAPALGKAAARSEGSPSSIPTLFGQVTPTADIQSAIAKAFQPDVDAAVVIAKAARDAGRIDEEEDAWVRVSLLGGGAGGSWGERYGFDIPEDMTPWFSAFSPSLASGNASLPEATVYTLPEGGSPQLTKTEKTRVRARVVPSLSARVWLQAELAYIGLGTATPPGQTAALGGDAGGVFGVRGGTRVLTRKRKDLWGVRPFDEISAVAAGGNSGGAPDDVYGMGAAVHLEAAYSIGLGYRGLGGGGLLVGVRPAAGLVRFKSGTPTYANVLPFARLEIARPKGALAVEAMGFALAGTEQWIGNLHIGKGNIDWKSIGQFFSLRVERSVHDLDLRVPNLEPALDPKAPAQNVGMTVVSVMYGISFL